MTPSPTTWAKSRTRLSMAALLTNLNENDILFVDEIHRLNRSVEEVLYPPRRGPDPAPGPPDGPTAPG